MTLIANHKDRKRARYRRSAGAGSAGGAWRSRFMLIGHREDVIRLAVECNRAREIHRVQILLDLKTGRAVFLDDGQRTVAMRAIGFHPCRIEDRSVGTSGKGQ